VVQIEFEKNSLKTYKLQILGKSKTSIEKYWKIVLDTDFICICIGFKF